MQYSRESLLPLICMGFVNLLTSKTRVAPLKPLTIPRLEFMSAEVLTNLVSRVRKAKIKVEIKEIRYWSAVRQPYVGSKTEERGNSSYATE